MQVFVFSAETGGRSSPIVPGARPAVVFRNDPHSLYCTRVVGTGAVSPGEQGELEIECLSEACEWLLAPGAQLHLQEGRFVVACGEVVAVEDVKGT